jgi:hypothetical protein
MTKEEEFYKLTLELCTWEDLVELWHEDDKYKKEDITIEEAIEMLKDDACALPF